MVIERGIKLLVDTASIPYVQGSTIDYVESLQGAGFQVNNPNVVAACGCGSSFRVAEEEEVSARLVAPAAGRRPRSWILARDRRRGRGLLRAPLAEPSRAWPR